MTTTQNGKEALRGELQELSKALTQLDAGHAIDLYEQHFADLESFHARNIHELPFDQGLTLDLCTTDTRMFFVSGAPRSGTSALGKLVAHHPDTAIFTELFSQRYGYAPELFVASNIKRFVQSGLLKSIDSHTNKEVLGSMAGKALVGDKRPNFVFSAALSLHRLKDRDVTVAHIVRDPIEVAASFLKRAELGTWSSERDHTVAVKELNLNNRALPVLIELANKVPSHRVIAINYKTFWKDSTNLLAFISKLGLDQDKMKTGYISHMVRTAKDLSEQPRELTPQQTRYVEDNFDYDAYNKALELCDT